MFRINEALSELRAGSKKKWQTHLWYWKGEDEDGVGISKISLQVIEQKWKSKYR